MAESQRDRLKRQAATAAAALVEDGMTLGLGSGSTFAHALRAIAERRAAGELRRIRAIPSSIATASSARKLGIPLVELSGDRQLDLTIDGADEFDDRGGMIKGGGGALLREKLIAEASERVAIAIDESKRVARLGACPLPVEVLPFGWQRQAAFLAELGARVRRRQDENGAPYLSDNGNYILDCAFGPIEDAAALARQIKARSGVIEHGLFLDLATEAFVATERGLETWYRDTQPLAATQAILEEMA